MNKITQKSLDTLHRRMAAVEAHQAGRAAKANAKASAPALDRLLRVLAVAMNAPYGEDRVSGKEHANFETELLALAERMDAGSMTPADHDVLAQLPAADLQIADMTVESLITCLKRGYDRVNE